MSDAVRFPVSCATAYDYLIDPELRAEWQSSLRRVDDVRGANDVVGQTWTDVTKVGARPLMELTDADRPHRWSERGTWRGISATLTLLFEPVGVDGSGCDVTATMRVTGRGLARPIGVVLDRLAPAAVRADLRSASTILGARGG